MAVMVRTEEGPIYSEIKKRVLVRDDAGLYVCGTLTGRVGERGKHRGHRFVQFDGRVPTINGQRGKVQAIPPDWFATSMIKAYELSARRPGKEGKIVEKGE